MIHCRNNWFVSLKEVVIWDDRERDGEVGNRQSKTWQNVKMMMNKVIPPFHSKFKRLVLKKPRIVHKTSSMQTWSVWSASASWRRSRPHWTFHCRHNQTDLLLHVSCKSPERRARYLGQSRTVPELIKKKSVLGVEKCTQVKYICFKNNFVFRFVILHWYIRIPCAKLITLV